LENGKRDFCFCLDPLLREEGPIAIKGEDPSIMGKALKYIIIDKFFITNKQIGQKKRI